MVIQISFMCMLLLVPILTATDTALAPWQIEYIVTNNAPYTAGGLWFEHLVGETYAKRAMLKATNFSFRVLNQINVPARRRPIQKIELVVEQSNDAHSVSHVLYNSSVIYIYTNYLETYNGDVKTEFTGILYNQVATILEWNGNGEAPAGLTSGITDYVRMKGGYERSGWVGLGWVGVGDGKRWDSGYDVTARFLGYCNKLKKGFIGELNAKMRNGYTVGYFGEDCRSALV